MEFRNLRMELLHIVRLATGILGMVGAAALLWGQQSDGPPQHIPLVTDWSHQYLIYSRQPETQLADALRREPRYWQQWLRRNRDRAMNLDPSTADTSVRARSATDAPAIDTSAIGMSAHLALGIDSPINDSISGGQVTPSTMRRGRFKRDWSVSLGPGATVGAGQYPAKFSFDVSSAHCGSDAQPDYAVFNTSLAGSFTQATVVAFDNLYAGCGGIVPSTYWAYNTGGTVLTSPVLSLDGTQLAFVQAVAGQAQMVLLKWKSSIIATSTTPDAITNVSANQYPTCTAPCMTTLAFSGGANDTNSIPFYDYSGDALYVGDDGGTLHRFTPVFTTGTPTEVTTGGWPVVLATGLKLSSPVYDSTTGRVFVGSAFSGSGSQLFAVVGATGVVAGTSSTARDASAKAPPARTRYGKREPRGGAHDQAAEMRDAKPSRRAGNRSADPGMRRAKAAKKAPRR